jgi:glutaminase
MKEDRVCVASPIQEYLEQVHAKYRNLRAGTVATYIPELAKADPDWFGICITTTDGHIYGVGDTRQPFTIQSISKPFTYGLALEDRGLDTVLAKIGVEPTGDAFNSISLAPGTGCPLNPMINAGAIATASLIAGASATERLERILSVFSLYAGRSLSLDNAVYESERATGHRNRAIGHMLRNFDILTEEPEPTLDLYFRQCSIAVDCVDLSVMAATLANGGVNPVTGEHAVRSDLVQHILSVMTTCGMYDYAGEWVYRVGMPAKSGVAGGILAVLPGQLGIGVFSPSLDARGNSVRGVAVCKELSPRLNLHLMRAPRSSRSAMRTHYTLERVRSKRLRSDADRLRLDSEGASVCILELQGDLTFAAVDAVVRRVVKTSGSARAFILDLRRVTAMEACATEVLFDLLRNCQASGVQLLFVNLQHQPRLLRFLDERTTALALPRLHSFADLDRALERCEDLLLGVCRGDDVARPSVRLEEHEVCRGLSGTELKRFGACLEHRSYPAGALIVCKGDPAEEIYLLLSGEVSVVVDLPNGRLQRLATLSAGMAFGELAVVNRAPRNADVRADTPVECAILSTRAFDELGRTAPRIKMQVLENLLRNVSQMLGRANRELAALAE